MITLVSITDEGFSYPLASHNGHTTALPDKYAAERDVLGACMLDVECCARAVELLRPDHFADHQRRHHRLFEIITDLFQDGTPVNMISVSDAGFDDAGYLAELTTQATAVAAHTENRARIIQEQHIARQCYVSWQRGLSRLKAGDDVFDVVDEVQRRTTQYRLGGDTRTHIRYGIEQAIARTEQWRSGEVSDSAPTGFYSVDRALGGFPVSEQTTIAAPTSAGKTSLLRHVSLTQAMRLKKQGDRRAVLVVSAEMTREQMAHGYGAAQGRTNLRTLRSGEATSDLYDDHIATLQALTDLNIHIDDDPAPTFDRIQARCQQLEATDGLAFVGIDYDEKIDSEGDTEELRVSAIAQGLKRVAKSFSIPIVTLSQYSRKATALQWPEDRWLRYSGKKEQESAMILHWVWPAYWIERGVHPYDDEGKPRIVGYVEGKPERGYLFCTKNRFGSIGKVPINFYPKHTRFEDPNEPTPL